MTVDRFSKLYFSRALLLQNCDIQETTCRADGQPQWRGIDGAWVGQNWFNVPGGLLQTVDTNIHGFISCSHWTGDMNPSHDNGGTTGSQHAYGAAMHAAKSRKLQLDPPQSDVWDRDLGYMWMWAKNRGWLTDNMASYGGETPTSRTRFWADRIACIRVIM